MKHIIDLSEHNTVTNWESAAKNIDFAILRIGYRGSIAGRAAYKCIMEDAKYKSNLAGCRKYGIPFTVYFFPTSITDEEAVEEAVWIRDRVKDLGLKYPVFLDSENVAGNRSGRADQLSKDKRTHLLRVISDHLLSYGIPCGVYSYTSWLANNVDLSKLDPHVINNTWVAQNPKLTYTGKVALWQYGTSKFSWTSAPIDVNKKMGTFDMTTEEHMAYYRNVIVDKAKSYLGVTEGTAKFREIIDKYNAHKPLARGYAVKYTDEWCATFVSSVAIQCGYTAIIPTECGCPQMITLAKNMGIWKESDSYKPSPGDIILYDWQDNGNGDNTGNPDHIGYVEAVSGSVMTIIEGNYNEVVRRRTVQINGKYIRGFIAPKYTAANKPSASKVSLTIKLPELHPGDTGESVKLWQFISGAPITGVLDKDETLKWQKAHGKKQDGWVGKGCWTKGLQLKGWM